MTPPISALLTDLYQLTMVQAYLEHGMQETAVFEFFVRRLPASRAFLMAAGLEQVLEYLETLRITDEELAWLAASGRFSQRFIDYAAGLRFTGDVHAMPEGTLVFPNEPLLRVTAPLPEAQLVETRLMNLLNFQTMVASKAARCVLAANGRPLIDFGLRRAHGAEAGLLAARAGYLAGFAGTATVLAGLRYGIPIYGTMAHSFVQAHAEEAVAFEHFAESHPDNVFLLIDTYDTEEAARKVVGLAPRLAAKGWRVNGVRLDSGDLAEHARKVREILDQGGLSDAQILVSGNLDERRVRDLVESGAPIDSYAVGTAMTTSADAPALDCAYKLQEYAGQARRKRSEGKATWPGAKQVYRTLGSDGTLAADVVTVADEKADGVPLLQLVMKSGRRLGSSPRLESVRRHAQAGLESLPPPLRRLDAPASFEARISEGLRALAGRVDRLSGA